MDHSSRRDGSHRVCDFSRINYHRSLPQKLVTLFCTCIFSSVMDLFLNSYDPKQADINPTCFKSKELLT